MCAIDDAPYPAVYSTEWPTARRSHACDECGRTIYPGERYRRIRGLWEDSWSTVKECRHCHAAGAVMNALCGGYPHGELYSELTEHWWDGYRSVAYGRLIVGVKRRWRDGLDPVPTGVSDVARALLADQVDPRRR